MTEPTDRLLRDAERYLSALHGSVARHDNLAANFGCAGCELRDRLAAELRAPAVSAGQAPATDQTADVWVACSPEWLAANPGQCAAAPRVPGPEGISHLHPAPAAELPAPTDRAAVLREEAALIRAHCPDHLDADSAEGSWADCHCPVADDMESRAAVARAAGDYARALATPPTGEAAAYMRERLAAASAVVVRRATDETPGEVCGPVPDQCDAEAGEPCANHEREQAHAEGEHCFCGPECEGVPTGQHREVYDETRPLCACGRFWPCPLAEQPAVGAQQPKEAEGPRTVCVCGHTRGEHLTVGGRLLCDECVPDSPDNLVCKEFEAL